MMKPGFTLIEIIIVVLISSVIAINLYQTFFQVSRTVTQLTNVIEVDLPLIPLHNQLERDITGIFTPQSTIKALLEEESKKKKEPTPQPNKNQEKKTNEKEKTHVLDARSEEPQKTEKKIDNIFHVVASPGQLTLSFISTGGIETLEFDGKIRPVPHIRRIAYVLQPDPAQPGTSKLVYRFQADKLDIQSIEKPDFLPSYDLLTGIKRLTVEFTVFSVPKEALPGDEKEKKDQKQEPIKLKEWNEKEIFTKYRTLIPAYINFKGTYIDPAKIEHDFEFNFKVPTYSYIKEEKSSPQELFKKLTEFIEEKLPTGKPNAKPNGARPTAK